METQPLVAVELKEFLKAVIKQESNNLERISGPCFPADTDLGPNLTDGRWKNRQGAVQPGGTDVWTGFKIHSGERHRVIISPHLSLLGHASEITMTTFLKIARLWSGTLYKPSWPSPTQQRCGTKEQSDSLSAAVLLLLAKALGLAVTPLEQL